MEKQNVKPADGKLGIMVVGLGAVTSTFMTGVLMARKGLAKPVGSMTQYDKIRVGKGADKKYLSYSEIVPLAQLDDIEFGAWDVYPADAYRSAMYAEVLKEKDIEPVKDELEKIVPMKAAFDKNFAKRLDGDNVMEGKTRWEMVEQLREDIRRFKKEHNCSRIVVAWAASTEIYVPVYEPVHGTLASLEKAVSKNEEGQSMLDTFSLEDNIYLPLVLAGKKHAEMKSRLDEIAEPLGITNLLKKYPYEVSGGQKQRAAVARALITGPRIILADEPTGALDSKSSDELLDLFTKVNQMGQTVLMVTHSTKAASHASRVMFIKDGVIFHQIYKGDSTDTELYQKISDTLTLLAQGGDLK